MTEPKYPYYEISYWFEYYDKTQKEYRTDLWSYGKYKNEADALEAYDHVPAIGTKFKINKAVGSGVIKEYLLQIDDGETVTTIKMKDETGEYYE